MSEPAEHVTAAKAVGQSSFGNFAAASEQSIVFPRGIPGFQDYQEFDLSPLPGIAQRDMALLQSVSPKDLTFVLQPHDHDLDLIQVEDLAEAAAQLELDLSDCCVMLIATLHPADEGYKTSVNLRAPVLIDTTRCLAWQVVLSNEGYPLRHMLE